MFRFITNMVTLFCLFIGQEAHAQNRNHHIYVDTDNNPATGCVVNIPALGAQIDGVEGRFTLTTDSGLPPSITNTAYHECTGAVFDGGTNAGNAALGLNNGLAGEDVFEMSFPSQLLGIDRSTAVIFYVHTQSDTAEDVMLDNGNGGPIFLGFSFPVPGLDWLGIFLLIGVLLFLTRHRFPTKTTMMIVFVGTSSVALAMVLVVDGMTDDWMGIAADGTDPTGDTSASGNFADITAVFVREQNNNVFVRLDVVDVENQVPTITSAAAVSVQENQTAVIDVNAIDPEGDVEGAGLSYAITGAVDDALFAIEANTGVLTFQAAPDFENPTDVGADNVYNVQVTVTDSGAATDVQDLAVTVTNDVVDDTAVSFQTATSSTSDEGTVLNVVVELSATAPLTAAVSVDVVDASGGTASDGTDYTSFGTQTLTFPMGAIDGTTMNATFMPIDDNNVENNETVNLQLQNISGPALLDGQTTHTATISEDDVATVEFDSASSATTDESTPLDVVVRLNIPSGGQLDVAVTVDAVDAGTGSATSGVDYTAFGTQTVTFPIGATNGTTQNTALTPLDDPNSKGNETVDLSLQNLTGPPAASLGAQTAHTVTITDDEASVFFQSTSSSTTDEGTVLNVVLELSTPIPLTAPMMVDVVDAGGGSATSGTDYTAFGTQTVTFPMGSTNGTTMNAVLTPINDNNVENNETVELALQNLVGTGSIGTQSTHTVTITEDDSASIAFQAANSVTVNEATPLNVNVLLSIPGGGQLDVAITADVVDAGGGSATSGADYNAFGTQMVTFAVGSMNGAAQVTTLTPIDDPTSEGNETVNLALQNFAGPVLASLGAPNAHTAAITDDEASVAFQSAASSTVDESVALNVVVELSTPIPLGAPIMVDVIDAGGSTATSGSDYIAIGTQTVTFPIGSTNGATMNAMLVPIDDPNVEDNETMNLQLQNLVGIGSIGTQSTHSVTITENDTANVEFQVANSATVDESTALNIDVLLNIPSGGQLDVPITVDGIDAGGGSATSGVDYTAFGTQTVTFPVGSMNTDTQTTTLTPIDDPDTEGDETVNLQLQNLMGPVLASLGAQTTHTATISDDDNTAPTANADTYETIGNTGLHATAGAASTPVRHPNNVLANDTDPELDVLTVIEAMGDMTAPFTGTSTLGGDVVVQANGDFTYYPPVGMTSMMDTFDYTISDGSLTSSSTVTINITADLVYYVDNTAGAGGTGRDDSRFDDLTDVPMTANSTIFIFQGLGSTLGDITLAANQVMIGNGVNLEFNVNNTLPDPDVLIPSAVRPVLTGTTTLGTNNTIRGLDIGNTGVQTGITGNTFGTLTLDNVDIFGTGEAVDLTNGDAAVTFGTISSASSATEGINLDNVTGNFTVLGLTDITNPNTIGVNIQNSNLTYNFGDVTVNNRNSAGVFINGFTGGVQNGTFGTITINNQNSSGTTALGIDNIITGGSTINVASVNINNNNANSSAIALSNNDGATINIMGGSVQNAAGAAVSVSNSLGSATYAGTINNTAGLSLQVLGNAVGVTTMSGNITDSGTGILLNNNTGASINFTGTLDLDTTTNTAFTATNGGTISATGTGSTIDTTTGTAVLVQNTTIGATNLNFQSVSAGTGAGTPGVGINLENTGTTGSLIVSGGTIQNKTGANGDNSTGIGVRLQNSANASLNNMQLNDFSNYAVRAQGSNNLSLINTTINGVNGDDVASNEGAILLLNTTGTTAITNSNISGGFVNQMLMQNTTGTATLNVNGGTIGQDAVPAGIDGNDGILVQTSMSGINNVTIDGVNFTGNRGDLVQVDASNNATQTVLIQNNNLNNTHPNSVGGGVTISGGGMGANVNVGYDVINNDFLNAIGNALTVNYISGSGVVSGIINNNRIGTAPTQDSGSAGGSGISVGAAANVAHSTTITNNTIVQVAGFAGIDVVANTDVNFNATIDNNTVSMSPNPGGFALAGFYAILGGVGTETGSACINMTNNAFDASAAPFTGNAIWFDQISAAANYNFPAYIGSPNGESAAPVGTASADLVTYLTGLGNSGVNGPFPLFAGIVDAGIIIGATGAGATCP